ncbi:MAG: SIMPL domain-containing protein [Holosporales bacterium]|jgi:hypothetical protein|nr:SIMPL domain-containing protein [Holosporales bacterium]
MESQNFTKSGFLSNFFLGVGIALFGFFIGASFRDIGYLIKSNTVVVKGLVERKVKSDSADLQIVIDTVGNELDELLKNIKKAQDEVQNFLVQSQFQENEYVADAVLVIDRHRDFVATKWNTKPPEDKYLVRVSIKIHSAQVDKVRDFCKNASPAVSTLMRDLKLNINVRKPDYSYSKLEEIRGDIIREAMVSARKAAAQMEKDLGFRIGKLKHADQGSINISGIHDGVTKEVRLVSYVTFEIDERN